LEQRATIATDARRGIGLGIVVGRVADDARVGITACTQATLDDAVCSLGAERALEMDDGPQSHRDPRRKRQPRGAGVIA